MEEHIKIIKMYDECQISMYGDKEVLSSLLYSSMVNNEKFALIVIEAAMFYTEKLNIEQSMQARLN